MTEAWWMVNMLAERMTGAQGRQRWEVLTVENWRKHSQDCRASQKRRPATTLAQWSPAGVAW